MDRKYYLGLILGSMELRHLRYFVAVAGKENISQAAKSLHISQPALSRQMHDLESELGVSLFKRGGKSVHLTEAGRVFLAESRAALSRIEDAISVTKAVAYRSRNRICVGYAPIPTAEILPLALRAFQVKNPKAKVDLRAMTTQEMIRALRRGEIDVSLMADGLSEDLEGLTIAEICSYPLCVVLSKKHRFAQNRVVRMEELAKEPIISLSRRGFRWYNALVERVLSPYNRNLEIVEEFDDSRSLIAAVEAGRGLAIVGSVVALTAGRRLAFRPLRPDPQPLSIVVAYRQMAATPLLEEFLSCAKSVQVDSPSSGQPRVMRVNTTASEE